MHILRLAAVALMLASRTAADEPLPDWCKWTSAAPTDLVYAASLRALAAQHHKARSTDDVNKIIGFHLGMSPLFGGYDMQLKVAPGENNSSNVSVDMEQHHTNGYRNLVYKDVRKILDGIQKELAKAPHPSSK